MVFLLDLLPYQSFMSSARLFSSLFSLSLSSVYSFCSKHIGTVLLVAVQETAKFTLFPGRDVPSCFNYKATRPSPKIYLPQTQLTSEILGFSACVMIRTDGQYPMSDLKIRCLSRGVCGSELVALNDEQFSVSKSFSDMYMESDHLLLFRRSLTRQPERRYETARGNQEMCGAPDHG